MARCALQEEDLEDAKHCPLIIRTLDLTHTSLLERGRLREYAIRVASKRLAEAVAQADGQASPGLKRARTASSTSLESMASSAEDRDAADAVLGLAKLAAHSR